MLDTDNVPTVKVPRASELFAAAKASKYDSLGLYADLESQAVLDKMVLEDRIKALITYRTNLWRSLGFKF